jgi:ribonuclease J
MTKEMQICIHRGSKEIGGSCVELRFDGTRLLVDVGLPLDKEFDDAALPESLDFGDEDARPRALLLSHGHRDHWGLLPKVPAEIEVFLGRRTLSIMRAAAPFVPGGFVPERTAIYEDRKTFEIGPFAITPYLMDHSGFDAYGFLIEADGKRVYYSGDVRGHGRKAALFERFVSAPPQDVDVLLMEGSSLGRLTGDERFETEDQIEARLADSMRSTSGIALVACSAQNIDRVVSVYRAAKRSGRQLLVDAYAAEVLKATETRSIPKPTEEWSDVKVYIPQAQRRHLVEKDIASVVDGYTGRRIFPEALADVAAKSVMIIRPWMLRDLERYQALAGAKAIWSQWEGYLSEDTGLAFQQRCAETGVPFEVIHTSGHADPHDLRRFAEALKPRALVPIHTFHPERFEQHFSNVRIVGDGHWFSA